MRFIVDVCLISVVFIRYLAEKDYYALDVFKFN